MQLTILMPCLNEVETLGACIQKALGWVAKSGISAEVLIADNGSSDGSQDLARSLGARVVDVNRRGYGAALYEGSAAARGEWIIMGDSDGSYDFSKLDAFIVKLGEGFDLVMGNRFLGGIAPGAMPWKNRVIGNPVLTSIGRMLFRCPANDFHCGLRAVKKAAFLRMDLRTEGMEYASEMVIKANLFGMRICEVSTTLSKDGRSRPPHLRPWRDGWRHLRFMLLFSPQWLFLIPGALITLISLAIFALLLSGPVRVGSIVFDIHTLLFAEAGIILGVLALSTGSAVRMFGMREGLLTSHPLLEWVRRSPILEVGGAVGLASLLGGMLMGGIAVSDWAVAGFGALAPGEVIRKVSVSTLLFIMGGIVLMLSLLTGFLSLPMRKVNA